MSNILVAYFSASGKTERAALHLADALDAQLFEIKAAVPYTKDDLNWMNKESRSTKEMNDPNCRPAIQKDAVDIQSFEGIFLGFPIWWYTAPRIINTFLESYDFKGQTVIPFATSGSSGIERADGELEEQYPDIDWEKGKLMPHRLPPSGELKTWAQAMNLHV